MAGRFDVSGELKQQGKFDRLFAVRGLDKHAVAVLGLLQDISTEPLGDKCDLEVTGITVVTCGYIILTVIGVKRLRFALRFQGETHSAGDCDGCGVGVGTLCLCLDCGMYVFKAVFDFVNIRH